MTIKKTHDKNQYLLVKGGHWVRDFGSRSRALDINNLYSGPDQRNAISNEAENRVWNIPQIDTETVFFSDMVIVSDGYDYKSCVALLQELGRKKIPCVGLHSVLATWEPGIRYNYFLANNPTSECMTYLPRSGQYTPSCIASVRTHPEFIRRYRARGGVMHWYTPSPSRNFNSRFYNPGFFLDDYRNSICATINLACRWQANRLLLLAPHDLYVEHRDGMEELDNSLYMYPQQRTAHNFIDASLYWLNQYNDCHIGVVTSGPSFRNAQGLNIEEAARFFAR